MANEAKTRAEENRARADEAIDQFFEFVGDIVEDPTPLQELPDEAEIDLTPVDQAGPLSNYTASTRRLAISVVKATDHERSAPPSSPPESDRRSA